MVVHFAVAVVTKERPTEARFAAALNPFGPTAGGAARWDWWALGGRYTGALCRFSSFGLCPIEYTITNEVEFPDDELTSFPPPSVPAGGVDAIQNRYAKEYMVLWTPRALLIDGQWHESRGPSGGLIPTPEIEVAVNPWPKQVVAMLHAVPDEHWISIVHRRAPGSR
jgi:hypothetical protein